MRRIIGLLLIGLTMITGRAALPSLDELDAFLQPAKTEKAELSPDGKLVAYTKREGVRLNVTIASADDFADRREIEIARTEGSGAARLVFFRWTPDRSLLVYALRKESREEVFVLDPSDMRLRRLNAAAEFDEAFDPALTDMNSESSRLISLKRYPRCLGFTSERPSRVVIEVVGSALSIARSGGGASFDLRVMTLPLDGGDREVLHTGTYSGRVFYDRQWRPRLVFAQIPDRAELNFLPIARSFWSRKADAPPPIDQKTASRFTCRPENFFGPRSIPLGFDKDPSLLYYASNADKDTVGLYSLDLKTGKRRGFSLTQEARDFLAMGAQISVEDALVFDPYTDAFVGVCFPKAPISTRWIDGALGETQASLQRLLPGRVVRILSWDRNRARFLLAASSSEDPGRYFVYDTGTGRLTQFARSIPWIDLEDINPTKSLEFETETGEKAVAYVTIPRIPLLDPPPLLVLLQDAPWSSATAAYNRDAQIAARMGFLVLCPDYRGLSGRGRRHLEALFAGFDTAPFQDIRAAMSRLAKSWRFDKRRVVLMGHGFGGYLAARGCQLYPKEFRCGIAWNAPVDPAAAIETVKEREFKERQGFQKAQTMAYYLKNLGASDIYGRPALLGFNLGSPSPVNFMSEVRRYLYHGEGRAPPVSLLADDSGFSLPLLFLQDSNHAILREDNLRNLKRAMGKSGAEFDFVLFDSEDNENGTNKLARAYARVVAFLNETIYDYDVKVGPVEVRP